MGKTKLGENKMQENYILQWLKSTRIPLSVISRHTNISRKSLTNWKQGKLPTTKSLNKLTQFYNNSVSVENESTEIKLGNDGNIDKDYVLNLQQERIKALEKESFKQSAEDMMWKEIQYDFTHVLQIKWHISNPFKLQRAYIDVGNMKIVSQRLGYTEDELQDFWKPNKFYFMRNHPVDNILTENCRSSLSKITIKTYGTVKKLISLGSRHFIPMNIEFKHKNGWGVRAASFIRVNSNLIIEAKTKFL